MAKVERVDYLDELRGFAILLVVLGHIYLPFTQLGSLYPVAEAIYSFHMPLFFFISGYLCEQTNRLDVLGFSKFIKKKFIALIVPYLFWLIPGYIMFSSGKLEKWGDLLQRFMFFPNLNIWFLPVLFLMMLLYTIQYFILGKSDNTVKRLGFMFTISLLLALLGIVYHSYFCFVYIIYVCSFWGGSLLYKRKDLQNRITNIKIMGGASLILLGLWYFFPYESNGRMLVSMMNLCANFVCAALSIIVFYNFFYMNWLPLVVKRILQEFGKMSLVIYLLPIQFLPEGFVFLHFSNSAINLLILFLGILQCVIACIIGKCVFAIPYLRLIMFGKK